MQHVTEQLATGAFAPGSRLPPERTLAQDFGISRGTVRRVLKHFEDQKRITGIKGSGTFVLPLSRTSANLEPTALPLASPAELLEARLYIEPLLPELIVRNANALDFERMQACLVTSEQVTTVAEFERLDHELHRLFAMATHNAFFVEIMDLVGRARIHGGWGVLKERSYTPERHQQYMDQHRAIVNALTNRDLEASRRLMTEHLLQIRKNLFGG